MIRKTTWLLFGRVTSDGLAFLFYISLARTFGQSGIGDYAFAFALASLFVLGVEFGLRPLITRDIARNPALANDYCGNLLFAQALLAIIVGLVLHLVSVTLGYSGQMCFLVAMAFIGVALKTIGVSFVAFLEAIEAMDKSAIIEIIARLTIVAFGLALILAGVELRIVMIAHVIGGAAYLGLALYWVKQHFGLSRSKISLGFIKKTLHLALPFAGASALYILYSRIDLMMIHHFIGEEETGLYAVAFRSVEAPLVVPLLVGVALYPVLSRAYDQGETERNQLFLSTLKWLGILGMAGAVTLISIGDRLVVMLFGQEFVKSGILTRWMAILLFIGFVKVPYWRLLLAMNHEHTQLRIQGLSVGLNLIFNILLIPKWGAFGAVWASIISEAFLAAGLHLSCARLVAARYIAMASRLLLIGGVSAALGIFLREFLSWPIVAGVAVATFMIAAVTFRLISAEDRRRFTFGINRLYFKTVGGVDGYIQ
ncbi:MAG: flippase [Candidatus Hodarchaeota archaeon]